MTFEVPNLIYVNNRMSKRTILGLYQEGLYFDATVIPT